MWANDSLEGGTDPNSQEELDVCIAYNDRLLKRALSMDGTITGEHGIGFGKREQMCSEHGDAVDVMSTIKQALDPLNILNLVLQQVRFDGY